ncbi:MAG: histidine phosphatase family protein [Alphaproteobacteria bacterium]|nr:histidine phosphatase family protein [Alphaproteobacteria bacterium]
MSAIRHIYVLRHAEAASGGNDRNRPLTKNGQADAGRLGAFMAKQAFVPELVLCSPAQRTRETLDAACPSSLSFDIVQYPEVLYNAPAGTIFEIVKQAPDEIADVLVVAHNPGVSNFVQTMAGSAADGLFQSMRRSGYPPGTLSILALSLPAWQDLQPGAGRLDGFFTPADYSSSPEPSPPES